MTVSTKHTLERTLNDSDVVPLTEDEKERLLEWILANACPPEPEERDT